MSDLAEFVLARLAEDEAEARYVLSDYAQHAPDWDSPATAVVNLGDPGIDGLLTTGDGPIADHIARWDPARVLAECEAKRRIVKLHGRAHECSVYQDGEVDICHWCLDGDECSTLRLLALPDAAHADFREEWRV